MKNYEIFWKFIGENNKSLTTNYFPLHYKKYKWLTVKNADTRASIQCAEGIHCLEFTSEKLEHYNVIMGPKVAYLQVNKKDIIHRTPNGKCRVKKARVIDIQKPEDWMITGNGNPKWALEYAKAMGHNELCLQTIVDCKATTIAVDYADAVLAGHDPRLYQLIYEYGTDDNIFAYINWILKQPDGMLFDRIKNSYYAISYFQKFAVMPTPEIKELLLQHRNLSAIECFITRTRKYDEELFQVLVDCNDASIILSLGKYVLPEYDERVAEKLDSFTNKYYLDAYKAAYEISD